MATVVYKCNNFFHIRGNYNINFCKKRLMDNQNLNTINRPLLQENSNPIIEEASNQQHFSQGNNKPTNNQNQGIQPQFPNMSNQSYPIKNYEGNFNQNNPEYPISGSNNIQLKVYAVENNGTIPLVQCKAVPEPPRNYPPLPNSQIPINHKNYQWIVQNINKPCPFCFYAGQGYVRATPGCTAITWAIMLHCSIILMPCFCLPLISVNCLDIVVLCSRCRNIKDRVEKDCCDCC